MTSVRPDTLHDYHERLNRVLVFIDQNRSEELSLDRLAAIACLSACHFHRIFRALVGEPLGQYVQRIRLETAALQLQTSTRNVLEIALDAGYENAAAFSRAFEQRFGMAPTECRASHRFELQVRAAQLKQSNTAAMISPEIRQRPATQVAFVRHIGPYHAVGAAWHKLCSFAGQNQLLSPKVAYIGISRDDPKITAIDQLRYDACITLEHALAPSGEIGVQTIPGGRYAVFLHSGPYENFSATYDMIYRDWLPLSHEQLRDQPEFEIYLNTVETTTPENLRTEIWIPLEG
ncbi:MAG: AraC family transcriptional regulator [Verrucomicrobia bacterium]|nr:AraC family transcriptional regulator [Verrucomicrobiota bacterium]